MKKKLVVTLAATMMVFSLVACGKTEDSTTEAETTEAVTEAETTEEEVEEATAEEASAEDASSNDALMEFISEDGWSVNYDGELVEASELNNGAQFVYIGESAGTNMVSITYDPEGVVATALYDITSQWGVEDEKITYIEGFFPGTDDKWGFWRILDPEDSTDGMGETAIATEYNGGVLVVDYISHNGDDEEMNLQVSGVLSDIIDSIKYEKFEDQTMFDYLIGTYSGEDSDGTKIEAVFNADHTGTLTIQDTVDFTWSADKLTGEDFEYVYSMEQDVLSIDYDGNGLKLTKQ